MSMNVSGVSDVAASYSSTTPKKTEDKEVAKSAVEEVSATYEKSTDASSNGLYSINKMSQEDRTAMIAKLKEEVQSRQNDLQNIVSKMLGQQANVYGTANDMWQILADGKFTVDAATKKQAQEDISEDGYWGVKQTSQRLFDFACALAGDDVEKMKKMQNAMEKGFKQAEKTWGKALPQISHDTMAAANKLFDDYYASKQVATE